MAPDDDIQFDFFDDEPATSETAQTRIRPPLRAPRLPKPSLGGGGGSTHESAPLIRLVLLVFFVIFLVLVFSLLIQSCTTQSRHAIDANYMAKVSAIAQQSTLDGKLTEQVLTSQGLKAADIVTRLNGIAGKEQQNVDQATSLIAPGRLRSEHSSLVEALQLRVSGVSGLAKAFQAMIGTKPKASDEATVLSQEAYRLLSSDIVWADLFQKPTVTQLGTDGVRDIVPPDSTFLANPDQIVPTSAMLLIVNRILGNGGGTQVSGLHGTNLVSVAALPNGTSGASETLTAGTLNTVTTSSSLVFQVTIHDGGDFQEVQIPVELQINRPASSGGPITKTEKVQVVDPGQDASVVFKDLGQVPFASQTTVTVTVGKVPGETNVANNSATYNVIFSLPA